MSEILHYHVTKKRTRSFKPLAPDYSYANNMHFGNMLVSVSNYSSRHPACLLFVFLALQPLWLYFHNPVAGFSLLVFEVS